MSGTLSPEDRQQLVALFDRASDLPAGEHAAFVERECGANVALRDELSRLLKGLVGEDFLNQVRPGAPLPAGTWIGPYKLLERIGEGGMGEVYAAEQLEPVARRVALKLIKLGMDTKQVIARFEAERQALAMMDHPHIAKVLDAGATDRGRPYFVMELVQGIPITDYCDQQTLSTEQRLKLFASVCRAVQHAHMKGVIHRDLKPSNVMVTSHDEEPMVKVIDFGIAKATDHRLTQRTLFTEQHQILGTPEYMAPEQAETSCLDIDTRADVYSLGVLLYELLTGTRPLQLKSLLDRGYDEMLRMIKEEEPQKPSTRVRTVGGRITTIAQHRGVAATTLSRVLSGDLDWIVMRALEKDRSRRYETASALARDIGRYLNDEPVEASPPTAVYRLQKYLKRHMVGVTAGSAVVVALLIGLMLAWSGYVEAKEQTGLARLAEAEAKTQRDHARIDRDRADEQAAANAKLAQEKTAIADEKSALADELTIVLVRGLIAEARAIAASSEAGRRKRALAVLKDAAALLEREAMQAERRSYYEEIRSVAVSVCNAIDLESSGQRALPRSTPHDFFRGWCMGPNKRFLLEIDLPGSIVKPEWPPESSAGVRVFDLDRFVETAHGPRRSEADEQPLALAPDGRLVLWHHRSGRLCLRTVDAPADDPGIPLKIPVERADRVATFSPSGRYLAVRCGSRAVLWEVANPDEPIVLPQAQYRGRMGGPGRMMAFDTVEARLLLWNGLEHLAVYDIAERSLIAQRSFDSRVKCMPAFVGTRGILVATDEGYATRVALWDSILEVIVGAFKVEGSGGVLALDYNRDRDLMAVWANWRLSIHRGEDGRELARLNRNYGGATGGWVRFDPSGRRLMAGGFPNPTTYLVTVPVAQPGTEVMERPLRAPTIKTAEWDSIVSTGWVPSGSRPGSDPSKTMSDPYHVAGHERGREPNRTLVGWTPEQCAVAYEYQGPLSSLRFYQGGGVSSPFDPNDAVSSEAVVSVGLWSDKATTVHDGMTLVWKLPQWSLERVVPAVGMDATIRGVVPLGLGDLAVGKFAGNTRRWFVMDTRGAEVLFTVDGENIQSTFSADGSELVVHDGGREVTWDLVQLRQVFEMLGVGPRHEPHPLDDRVGPVIARAFLKNTRPSAIVAALQSDPDLSNDIRELAIARVEDWPDTSPRALAAVAWRYSNLSWTLIQDPGSERFDPEEAIRLNAKALELAPSEKGIWGNYGNALYRTGKLVESIEACSRDLQLCGDKISAWHFEARAHDWFIIAMAHHALGNVEDSLQAFERAESNYVEVRQGTSDARYYALLASEARELLPDDAQPSLDGK